MTNLLVASADPAAVGLQQAQPDFADRGEAGHGVPEPVEGGSAGDGDGGRGEEFGHTRSDEGDSEQVVVVEVDHHPDAAGVAVGIQVGASDRGAEVDVHCANPMPGPFGLLDGQTDGGRFRVASGARPLVTVTS